MQQSNNNREIRIFLSSTFRDMQHERDYLIKNIFPQIRHACRERLVEFTEVDLRWGVTQEEAEQGKVVRICLEEIDRCRPYFLGFMGERYGWAPSDGDLHNKQELIQQFPVVEASIRAGKSVTEMEVLHGVLNNPDMAGHAFFYLRAPALTETLSQQTSNPAEYFETDDNNRNKLAELKARIGQSGFPVRLDYPSIEALGENIKADLLAVLDERYPEDQTPNPLQAERNVHEAYAENRCQAYIQNPADISALDEYLRSCNPDAQSIPLVIGGESGLGKSALLAYWVNHVEAGKPEQFIIQHYVGVSGDATPTAVLRRIMLEIRERTQEQGEVPIKPDDIVQDFPLWLAKVRSNDPLLIILDAINQIEGDNLGWLPGYIPPNVTLVVSCLPGAAFDQLAKRGWQTHTVQPMDEQRREQLIDTYLANFRKTLESPQRQTLAHAPQCANPLFLLTVLEELRVFGSFEQLDARMQTCLAATNPAELFSIVLARMEADYGKQTVQDVMSAIWAARNGLSETELMGITGLTRLDISTFLLALDYHLARKGGLLNFFHDYLRQAVKARYLPSDEEVKAQHRKLAEWFDRQELDARKAEELPWQWQQAGEEMRLKNCISNIPMFRFICVGDEYELLGYWVTLRLVPELGKIYSQSLQLWEKETNPSKEEIADILDLLGIFLSVNAEHAFAKKLLLRALDIKKEIFGEDSSEVARGLNNLASVSDEMGDRTEAESLYRHSLAIYEKTFGDNHPSMVYPIRGLAGLMRAEDNYTDAESLFLRALSICEIFFGSNHCDTSKIVYDLALLYQKQGRYVEAEQHYRRALAIQNKVYGGDHPDIAKCIASLAGLLCDIGKLDEAESLSISSLASMKKILGAEHPDTANTMNHLAIVLYRKGDHVAAEKLCRKDIEIREKAFGVDHLYIAEGIDFLATLTETNGSYSEAESLYRRALAIKEKTLGVDHSSVASTLNNLAGLFEIENKFTDAEALYSRALAIKEKAIGVDHPDIADTLCNLGSVMEKQGKSFCAETLYRRALAIYDVKFHSGYPKILQSCDRLAGVLYQLGREHCESHQWQLAYVKFQEAIALARRANNQQGIDACLRELKNLEKAMQQQTSKTGSTIQPTPKGESTMSNMRITDVIVNWLEEQEWEDRPEVDEENQSSSTGFGFQVSDDFSVKCYWDAAEKAGFIKLYMYFLDSKIPASKLDEVIKFVNLVNLRTPIGSLAAIPDDRTIRFYTAIDVEDAALETQHLSNMFEAGLRAMKARLPQYMAICFGGKSAEEALEIEPE